MKLEVGQFARLKSGYICKIININDFREPNTKYGVEANYLKDIMFIGDDDIVKTSFNIVDLIEVGDYVNGALVVEIIKNNRKLEPRTMIYVNGYVGLYNEDIETIITHEQMQQIAYKVGE